MVFELCEEPWLMHIQPGLSIPDTAILLNLSYFEARVLKNLFTAWNYSFIIIVQVIYMLILPKFSQKFPKFGLTIF